MTFVDVSTNNPQFAFGLPELCGSNNKKLELDWNDVSGELTLHSADIPSYPAAIRFGLAIKSPIEFEAAKPKIKFSVLQPINAHPLLTSSQFGLPSFSVHFPSFKLPSSWLRILYGEPASQPRPLPHGEAAVRVHSSLPHLKSNLGWDGSARFEAQDKWAVSVSTNASVDSPQVLEAEGLQILRGMPIHVRLLADCFI